MRLYSGYAYLDGQIRLVLIAAGMGEFTGR